MSDVIQSDREAAASRYNPSFHPGIQQEVLAGERDHQKDVQAFAAHRIASSADLRAKLDVALEVLAELTTTRDTLAASTNPDPAQVTVAPVQHVVEFLDAMIEGLATIGDGNPHLTPPPVPE